MEYYNFFDFASWLKSTIKMAKKIVSPRFEPRLSQQLTTRTKFIGTHCSVAYYLDFIDSIREKSSFHRRNSRRIVNCHLSTFQV